MDKFGTICKNEVPEEILNDYLSTRKRNFEINKIYLEWQKEKMFNTLIFSKDDCAEYGFNVQEARELEKLGGFVKTGADEIPLTLLARSIKGKLKVAPIFLEPDCKDLISNYEDVSIEKSVKGQLNLAGCNICEPCDADILLYVNNFKDKQGEIVMKIPTETFSGEFKTPDKNFMIADVRFANGADNAFVKKLFEFEIPEIYEGLIEIKNVSRDPGNRCKVAVYSTNENIDPVGSCVGQKGIRIQNIINELNGEKIDVIEWNQDPSIFIAAALLPAEVMAVDINEEERFAQVIVPDDQLSLAIGKSGQNARLAAKLTNWKIDIKSENQFREILANKNK